MDNSNLEQNIELENDKVKRKKLIKKKYFAIGFFVGIVIAVLVLVIGLILFVSNSYSGFKTEYTDSPFNTNKGTGTNYDGNTNTDDNINDLSEEDFNYLSKFLDDEYLSDKYNGINILDLPEVRIRYVESILQSTNKAQLTTDDQNVTGQQLLYALYTDFSQMFINTFGDNYNLDNTIDSVSNNSLYYSVYNKCTSKPSVNDGNHVCWMGSSISHDPLTLAITNKNTDNGIYLIEGGYTRGTETGTYELKYTISNNNLYINSVILNKN